jgi:uncharacterized protein YbbC (DUF1343 family)
VVKTGLDLFKEKSGLIKEKKFGLIANQSSLTSDFRYSHEIFRRMENAELAVLFSPEHGFYGSEQDMIPVDHQSLNRKNEKASLPIVSLYGEKERSLKPLKQDIEPLDVLIFDLQDIGARYYTFIYTMSYCMEVCAEFKKKMIILDRPNPINGVQMEGPVLQKDFSSFVGRYPIPPRHGLTVGELSQFFNRSFSIDCDLEVIAMQGWKREMWFDETGLPWFPPSPNMPALETATVYPGTCLLEGTNLSEGRGTCRPFEWIGAPWIEAEPFAEKLNQQNLPGVHFRPIHFTPKFHKWKEKICEGVQIHVTDRDHFTPFLAGVALVSLAFQLYPDHFRWREEPYEYVSDRLAFDLLAGSDNLRKQIMEELPLKQIASSYDDDCQKFRMARKEYLLYD